MSLRIRAAEISDLDAIADLLILDAEQRSRQNLWKLDRDAREKVTSTVRAAMEEGSPPFRQQWLLAEASGHVVGITHTILLPVPPIYAGELGAPGLIMEDCFIEAGAPSDTASSLLEAAESDLIGAGANILIASSVAAGAWEADYAAHNYEPLTQYFAKIGLNDATEGEGIRRAGEADVPAIVASSAANRRVLFDLDTFWKPHPDADARFGNWMKRSLNLTDRDMLVSDTHGEFKGYAVAQPATSLHFPTAHDVTGIGFIDDYFHRDFECPTKLEDEGHAASALLQAAEAALAARGNSAALIVCPAAWASKASVLRKNGYETAIAWFIKR